MACTPPQYPPDIGGVLSSSELAVVIESEQIAQGHLARHPPFPMAQQPPPFPIAQQPQPFATEPPRISQFMFAQTPEYSQSTRWPEAPVWATHPQDEYQAMSASSWSTTSSQMQSQYMPQRPPRMPAQRRPPSPVYRPPPMVPMHYEERSSMISVQNQTRPSAWGLSEHQIHAEAQLKVYEDTTRNGGTIDDSSKVFAVAVEREIPVQQRISWAAQDEIGTTGEHPMQDSATPQLSTTDADNVKVMPPVPLAAFQMPTPIMEELEESCPQVSTVPNVDDVEPGGSATPCEKAHRLSSDSIHASVSKPTCSLNLVCYRSGYSGCKFHQIQVTERSRFNKESDFDAACKDNTELITTDQEFFHALKQGYSEEMCGFWRRVLFLKTLRGLRLLAYSHDSRPTIVPLDTFVLQEVLYAYNNPSKLDPGHAWIDWVFNLRQPDKRHALEFVEDWNGTRIAILGTIPLVFSTLVGLIWSIRTGDWQTAFSVASFILTAGTLLLALLAVISGLEASGRPATL